MVHQPTVNTMTEKIELIDCRTLFLAYQFQDNGQNSNRFVVDVQIISPEEGEKMSLKCKGPRLSSQIEQTVGMAGGR